MNQETTTEDFDIKLRQDLQDARNYLLRSANEYDEYNTFDFYAEIPTYEDETSALNGLCGYVVHTYNLILLMFMFICAKWLFDKCFARFNNLWRRF